MKVNKKWLWGIGTVLALSIFAFFGWRNSSFGQESFVIQAENVAVLAEEDHTYYVRKVPKDGSFSVFLKKNGDDFDYTLTDEEGQDVEAVIKETGDKSYEIHAPRSGYTEGARYTLTLGPDVLFQDSEIMHAETVIFAVERDAVEDYQFTEDVIEVNEPINKVDEQTIEIKDFNGEPGDIVVGVDTNNNQLACKIIEQTGADHFSVDSPAVDEIYAQLDVYGEYALDFHEAMAQSALETQLVESIKESDFYEDLKTAIYSEDAEEELSIGVEIIEKPEGDDHTLDFKLMVKVEPNETGLFGEERFKDHQVTLILAGEVEAKVDVDIQEVINWDIATIRTETLEWAVNVEVLPTVDGEPSATSQAFAADEGDVAEIVERLEAMTSDQAAYSFVLFEYEMPVDEIPGLTIATQFNLDFQLNLNTEADLANHYASVSTAGLIFSDQIFHPYSNFIELENEGQASFQGQFENDTNLQLLVNASLFSDEVASIQLQPIIGLQTKGYSPKPFEQSTENKDEASNSEANIGYYDPALYFDVGVDSHFQVLDNQYTFAEDMERKQITLTDLAFEQDKIFLKMEMDHTGLEATDGLVTPPDLRLASYYPRTREKEWAIVHLDDLTFTLPDGTVLEKQDQQIRLPETEAEELTIHTHYERIDGQTFEKEWTVTIPENHPSDLAGHSAFNQAVELYLDLAPGGNIPDYTQLTLQPDGSFTGEYLGIDGVQADPTIVFENQFSGHFTAIEKMDEERYALQVAEINYEHEIGTEWLVNQTRHQATTAEGIETGQSFILYTPGTPLDHVPQETLNWSTDYWDLDPYGEPAPSHLKCWVLSNTDHQQGFFSRDEY